MKRKYERKPKWFVDACVAKLAEGLTPSKVVTWAKRTHGIQIHQRTVKIWRDGGEPQHIRVCLACGNEVSLNRFVRRSRLCKSCHSLHEERSGEEERRVRANIRAEEARHRQMVEQVGSILSANSRAALEGVA